MAIYLDFNASTPIDKRVLDRMIDVYNTRYGNADSRTHIYGTQARDVLNSSRKTIAEVLNVDTTDVLFTSGATESNNMTILGLREYAIKSKRNHFITTAIEHKSVLEAMKSLERHGCKVDYVAPNETGRIRPEEILNLVTKDTLLVSVMHVNSETGVIQPIEEIAAALDKTATYFHTDGTQAFGKLNEQLRNTKYNMLSINAHKLGGPQGVGALVLRRDRTYKRPPIEPLMYGGSQERGFRPGTTPVALVAGFALAAELGDAEMTSHLKMNQAIKKSFLSSVNGLNYVINGAQEYCLPNTINISFRGVDAESIFLAMKEHYAFSNGSACNSAGHAPSYVLTSMGLEKARVSEAIRISWNYDTKSDFSHLVKYIKSMTD